MPALPSEIIAAQGDILRDTEDLASLSALARTSKGYYAVLTPMLYRRLTITRANSESIFYGVPRKARPPMRRPQTEFAAEFEAFQRDWRHCLYPPDADEHPGFCSDANDEGGDEDDGDGSEDEDGGEDGSNASQGGEGDTGRVGDSDTHLMAHYPPWSMTHDDDLGYDSHDYEDMPSDSDPSDRDPWDSDPSDSDPSDSDSSDGGPSDSDPAVEPAAGDTENEVVKEGSNMWRDHLGHCRHLTIAEMPPLSLLLDLVDDLIRVEPKGDAEPKDHARSVLLPNVTHLCIALKVQRVLADYRGYQHPLEMLLQSGHLVRPRHVCLPAFGGRALRLRKIDIFRRLGQRPVSSIIGKRDPIWYLNRDIDQVDIAVDSDDHRSRREGITRTLGRKIALAPGDVSITIHGVTSWGSAWDTDRSWHAKHGRDGPRIRTYRYFHPGPAPGLQPGAFLAEAAAVAETEAVELIGGDKNRELKSGALLLVADMSEKVASAEVDLEHIKANVEAMEAERPPVTIRRKRGGIEVWENYNREYSRLWALYEHQEQRLRSLRQDLDWREKAARGAERVRWTPWADAEPCVVCGTK